jgi:hypothetical protein
MRNHGLVFLSLCAAACGSNAVGDVDQLIGAMATQSCAWEFRCCTDPEIAQQDGHRFQTEEECVPYRTLALQNQLFLARLAAKQGRIRVDGAHRDACLSQLENRVCNPKPGTPVVIDPMKVDDCALSLIGSTAVGDECVYATECVDGARCVSDATAVGRGVCVPYQEETQICNADGDCDPKDPRLYCAQQDFHCHARGGLGAACAYTTDAQGKNPTLPMLLVCDSRLSLYCDPVSSTCKQLPADGEPCLSPPPPGVSSSCDPDPALQLVCETSGTGDTGVCRAPPTLGQDCSTSGGRCQKPYFCNYAKSPAVCDQPAKLGQSCLSVSCDTGLYCDSTTRTCMSLLADGQPCTSSSQCISLDCGFATGTGTTSGETCLPRTVTGAVQCVGR